MSTITRIRRRPPHAGWEAWRQARRRPPPALPATCPTCWGQGKIWEPSVLGLVPVICPECRNVR